MVWYPTDVGAEELPQGRRQGSSISPANPPAEEGRQGGEEDSINVMNRRSDILAKDQEAIRAGLEGNTRQLRILANC